MRCSESNGALDEALLIGQQRVHRAVFQERNQIANSRQAQAGDGRILRLVNHLIYLAEFKAIGHGEVRGVCEVPLVARNHAAGSVVPVAHRELNAGVLHIEYRESGVDAVGQQPTVGLMIGHELGAHQAGYSLRHRDVIAHQSGGGHYIELPPEPHERVAFVEQQPIS